MNRFGQRKFLYLTGAALAATATTASLLSKTRTPPTSASMSSSSSSPPNLLLPYTATFSVPLSCNSCTSSVSEALFPLPGITSLSYDIPSKLVHITTSQPPSAIVSAIQSTGRTAILRGTGGANTAAVCILETPWRRSKAKGEGKTVRGLVRLIEVAKGVTMMDLVLTGMGPGRYKASVRVGGDVSDGKRGVGGVFRGLQDDRQGEIGEIVVDEKGRGSLVEEIRWSIWEMVGRGFLVENEAACQGEEGQVLGVIARSAGVWENDKTVCSCTGKTLWEEREQMVSKGIS